jgi:hypothetical protein
MEIDSIINKKSILKENDFIKIERETNDRIKSLYSNWSKERKEQIKNFMWIALKNKKETEKLFIIEKNKQNICA